MDLCSPIEALFPGARGRLLSHFLTTSGEMGVRAAAEVADCSPTTASKVLDDLAALGVLCSREVPPSRLFSLNEENLVAQNLIVISQVRVQLCSMLASSLLEMSIPPKSAYVFGSVANGTCDSNSDVDVLVVWPRRVAEGSQFENWEQELAVIGEKMERSFGNRFEFIAYPLAELRRKARAGWRLWLDIKKHGILLVGDDIRKSL